MNKILILLLCLILGQTSCKQKPVETDKGDNLDMLVSDHFLDDAEYTDTEEDFPEETEEVYTETPQPSLSTYVGNGGGGTDSDIFVTKYKNFERTGDSPSNFAEAMIFPAIRMVYSDNFLHPKAKVLQATMEDNQHIIDMAISWRDHWVSNYELQEQLKVATDGSNPRFVITNKNTAAEALEFTEDNFKNEIILDAI